MMHLVDVLEKRKTVLHYSIKWEKIKKILYSAEVMEVANSARILDDQKWPTSAKNNILSQ